MQNQIRNLKAGLAGVGLCAAIVVGGALLGGPTQLVDYVSEPVVTVVGDVPQTGAAARDYRTLVQDGNYHAAFATNPEGGYGWSDNYSTQEEADASALAWCRADGDGCAIVARITPTEVIRIEDVPLSRTAALGAAEYGQKPGYKALALSEFGDWGAAWGHNSRAAAVADALASCRAGLVSNVPDGLPVGTCRVVWAE